jgi:7-carboxy-7-deazaguanine synthase
MKVNEIFKSIQGEGKYTGLPSVFLRLSGCNLRCKYCDTDYSYYEGTEYDINDIIKKIKKYEINRLCITGGEPLLNNEIQSILDKFKDFYVSIETNGSINLSNFNLYNNHNYTMDIKTPSSGCSEMMEFKNFNYLSDKDEIKFVISTKSDYEWAKDIISKYHRKGKITISTVFNTLKYEDVVNWILKDNIDVRFQIQLHKIIWDKDKRGV